MNKKQGKLPSTTEASETVLPQEVVQRNGTRRHRRRSWIVLGLIPVILLVAAVLAYQNREWLLGRFAQSDATSSPEASEPTLVVALGRLEPQGEVIDVATPSGSGDARIAEVRVREGDYVQAGDILAVLDNEQRLKAELQVAETKLREAKTQLEQTTIRTESEVAQIEADLQAAKDVARTAETTLKRQSELSGGAVSPEELDQSRLAVSNGKQKVAQLEAALRRYRKDSLGNFVDVSVALQAVQVAESNVSLAQAMLAQAYVTSPEPGQVLKIELQPGERTVQPTLLKLGNTDQMYARLEVYESDVPDVRIDAKVTLAATAFAQPLEGTVVQIIPLVKKQSIVSAVPAANTDARVVEVLVRLNDVSRETAAGFIGMQVVAKVSTQSKTKAGAEVLP